MANETRLERWLDRALARAKTPRGGAILIAEITTIRRMVPIAKRAGREQDSEREDLLWRTAASIFEH